MTYGWHTILKSTYTFINLHHVCSMFGNAINILYDFHPVPIFPNWPSSYLTRGFPFAVFAVCAVSLSAHPSHQRHGAICLQSHWPPSCHRGWNVPKSPSHRACAWPPGESTALRTGRKNSKKFQKLALERVSKEYLSIFSIRMYPWRHSNCGMKHLQHQRTACYQRKMVKLNARNLLKPPETNSPHDQSPDQRYAETLEWQATGQGWLGHQDPVNPVPGNAMGIHGHDNAMVIRCKNTLV